MRHSHHSLSFRYLTRPLCLLLATGTFSEFAAQHVYSEVNDDRQCACVPSVNIVNRKINKV